MNNNLLAKALCTGLLCSGVVFGSINNCPNGLANSNVNNGVTDNGAMIAAAGAGNDLASVAGCTAVDLAFTNFGNSTFSAVGPNGALNSSGAYVAETPSGTGNNPLTNPDSLTFSTVRGTAGTFANGNNNDGLNNFVNNTSTALVDQFNFNVGLGAGGNPSATVGEIDLSVANPVIQSGATGSIVLDLCTAGTGVITTLAGCNTAGGTFYTTTLTLGTNATQGVSLTILSPTATFDLTTVVNLKGTAGGSFAGFDLFSETFDEGSLDPSPEPSTFLLLGSALLCLGWFRFRRKSA